MNAGSVLYDCIFIYISFDTTKKLVVREESFFL